MSNSSYSDDPILNDIFDEEPTDPFIQITAQLNSAESVAGFSSRAGSYGYSTEPTTHWTERLSDELGAVPVDQIINLFEQEENR